MSDFYIDESHHHPVEFVNPRLDDPFIVAIVGQIASGKTVLTPAPDSFMEIQI